MSANLPPQFYAISAKLKEVKTPEEKISILEELLAITPKHKGTEKIQADIKTKIAKLRRQEPKKTRRENLYSVRKEGAGQIVITGPTNSGKSSLLNILTNAKTKVASYPFTTQIPKPAMMPYEDILIQLVDTPPLTEESPPWLKGIINAADGLLAVFDLSKDNVTEDIKNLKKILFNWKLNKKKIILLGNKADLKKSRKNLEKIGTQYGILAISCSKGIGIEKLKRIIFDSLGVIRVYTKDPGKSSIDFEHPFVLKKNSKLIELAREIHQDFAFSFKYAKLFKRNSKMPRIIGKEYLVKDKDIIEIHI